MIAIAYGVLGLIIGSFLNVLVLRHGSGRSLGGRSFCDTCGMQLQWYHLVPVFSYIALRGRCSGCGSRLSVQYPLVEALSGLVFVTIALSTIPLFAQVLAAVAFSLLLAIAVYDVRHTIIPESWVWLFVAVCAVFGYFSMMPFDMWSWVLYLCSGPAAALLIFAIWLVSRGRAMGLGDAKLALGIGYLLGIYWGVMAVFGAFVIGAIVSVAILLPLPRIVAFVRRLIPHASFADSGTRFTMKSEVPFGPFLACSCYITWVLYFLFGMTTLPLW